MEVARRSGLRGPYLTLALTLVLTPTLTLTRSSRARSRASSSGAQKTLPSSAHSRGGASASTGFRAAVVARREPGHKA